MTQPGKIWDVLQDTGKFLPYSISISIVKPRHCRSDLWSRSAANIATRGRSYKFTFDLEME